jgi:hypothetical protein
MLRLYKTLEAHKAWKALSFSVIKCMCKVEHQTTIIGQPSEANSIIACDSVLVQELEPVWPLYVRFSGFNALKRNPLGLFKHCKYNFGGFGPRLSERRYLSVFRMAVHYCHQRQKWRINITLYNNILISSLCAHGGIWHPAYARFCDKLNRGQYMAFLQYWV